jgi:hypothetical protein
MFGISCHAEAMAQKVGSVIYVILAVANHHHIPDFQRKIILPLRGMNYVFLNCFDAIEPRLVRDCEPTKQLKRARHIAGERFHPWEGL